MCQAFSKTIAVAVLAISALGFAACGESSEEKATKKVCSATSEISAQLKKLQTLPISSSFPSEAKSSVEAIGASVGKIQEAAPDLGSAREQEVSEANKAFKSEIVTITKDVASASSSSNLQAALKSAEPQIKASLNTLVSNYKKAFEALKC